MCTTRLRDRRLQQKLNFVGYLINKTGNRIPESRTDSNKMYKVINASPSEFTQNMELFRCYIHQWASSLQGNKSLTDGSQLSLIVNFVEYITYGLQNQHIVDIKEFGERVLQFGAKREELIELYHQHQDQHIRVPDSDKRREHSCSRSPSAKRHRSNNRGKQRHSPP